MLHAGDMDIAMERCMEALDHLNRKAVLETLAHLVRQAQGAS